MSHESDTNNARLGNQTRVIMYNFVREEQIQNNVEPVLAVDELQELQTSLEPALVDKIVRTIMIISDELDSDQRIQRLLSEVPPAASQQTVLAVANRFFERGVISWGNIAILFYFCYRMALRALNQPQLIRNIISWVADFIVDRVARWILERGGWGLFKGRLRDKLKERDLPNLCTYLVPREGIVRYASTLSRQAIGIFIGGFVAAGAVVAYHVWGR